MLFGGKIGEGGGKKKKKKKNGTEMARTAVFFCRAHHFFEKLVDAH